MIHNNRRNFFGLALMRASAGIMLTLGMVSTSLAETFSIDGTALNTNNQFPKLDGNSIMSTWPLSNSDPDQQFDLLSGSNGRLLKHRSTGRCLNAHYISNGGKVNTWPCNASDPDQNFTLNSSGNNIYTIQRSSTNFCIDMPSRGANQQIILWQCNNGANQRFTVNAGSSTNNSANTPYLPFDPGVSSTVTQGYNGTTSHGGSHLAAYNSYAIDLAPNRSNVSARAVRAGRVVYAGTGNNDGYGYRVIVQYNDGLFGLYAHLAQVYVATNASVVGGQGLGLIGTTGNSTGVHLHYAEGRRMENLYVMDRVPLRFVDAPNANFFNSGFSVTSSNPDNRR
jgi:murein DD-endopeptidase MepM/ murein hydrolase activator NlpD